MCGMQRSPPAFPLASATCAPRTSAQCSAEPVARISVPQMVVHFFFPAYEQPIQDVALPYMLSTRLPDDTLFLFFEADFRFHAEDALEPKEWLGFLAPEPVARSGNYSGAEYWTRPSEIHKLCAPELVDVVRICNQAARASDENGVRKGALVWLGWNASETGVKCKKPKRIQYGTQALAWTKQAAHALLPRMQKDKAEHFDLWLKRQLKTPGVLPDACYVQPPIGGFVEHESANLRGKMRKSSFNEPWALPGSGRELLPDGTHRCLRRFYGNEGDELIQLTFRADRSALWKTGHPPTTLRPDSVMLELLKERLGWMAADGVYHGPYRGQKWSDPQKWQQIVWTPDDLPEPVARWSPAGSGTLDNSVVQLSFVAERLVTLHTDDAPTLRSEKENGRQKRHRTNALNAYRHRCQPRDHEEARVTSGGGRIPVAGKGWGCGRKSAVPGCHSMHIPWGPLGGWVLLTGTRQLKPNGQVVARVAVCVFLELAPGMRGGACRPPYTQGLFTAIPDA